MQRPRRSGRATRSSDALVVWQDVSALEAALAQRSRLHLEAEGRADELASVSSERGRHRHLLDTILSTLPHHVSLWDRDERLVWANEQFAAGLGEPREHLFGRTWRELWRDVPWVVPLVEGALQSVAAGTPCTSEVEVAGSEGAWRACTFLPFGRDALLVITEDITERQRAEDRLRYHASVVDAVSDAIISTDTDLIIRSWNKAAERMYGWRADEVVGLKGADILRTEFPEGTSRETLAADLFSKGFWQGELVQHTKDGRPISVDATSIRFTDSAGRTIGAVSGSRDITERKRAAAEREELTRQIEAERDRLATILDAIPDAISIHDRDDRYVYVNPALMSAARAAPEDILGRSWPERGLDLDRIAPLANAVHEAFASGELRTAIFECPVDGVIRTYHALAVPLREAGEAVARVIVSSRDVTHILETEAALRESEEWLRLAEESANVAVWDWDVRTGLYTTTPEFFRLYGLEKGRTLTYGQWLDRVHPDDVARVESESRAALARGEPFDLEHRVVRPGGEIRWIQGIGRGVWDEAGTLVRVLGVNIDITARKAAEEVLAETVEEHRQALNNPLLGYALCEIITDDAGRPRDFVYLDVNPAFEAFTGLARERVLNRRVTEILVPAEVAELVQIYGNVALTGEPRTFQYPYPRWNERTRSRHSRRSTVGSSHFSRISPTANEPRRRSPRARRSTGTWSSWRRTRS